MTDKGKKGPAAPAPPPAATPAEAPPPNKPEEKKKSEQPKDEVGMRKGCRRYKWELKDSNREFWVMGHAEVKILSLGCLIGSLIMFTGITIHPVLTLIITMEISVFTFFFIIYTFAINRYLPFILWPISDLLNDLFACGFLVGAVVFAVKSRQTMPVHYAVYLLKNHPFWSMVIFL
uniref:CKLF like MARVEL transmembrane domain containing 2 n=1 Tax=Catagonus wagneri TaxID=51154 RepID=A0A8C3X837_9CETA